MPTLGDMSVAELPQYAENAQRLGRLDVVGEAVRERYRRRKASARDYNRLAWNHDRVAQAFKPFVEKTNTVKGNQRLQDKVKGFTHAGGNRIAGEFYVDSYTALKTEKVYAVFNCRIKNPGDGPEFLLLRPKTNILPDETGRWQPAPNEDGLGLAVKRYTADELEAALADWTRITEDARSQSGGDE